MALRMHSAAFHPSAALDSAASYWSAAGTNSSPALAKTAMLHLGKSSTAAELRKLPIKRLQRVCFTGRGAYGLNGQYHVLNAATGEYQLHYRAYVLTTSTRTPIFTEHTHLAGKHYKRVCAGSENSCLLYLRCQSGRWRPSHLRTERQRCSLRALQLLWMRAGQSPRKLKVRAPMAAMQQARSASRQQEPSTMSSSHISSA